MKTIYLECNMGAAGDMLAAALLELHPDPQGFISRLAALKIPGVSISAHQAEQCGIQGTKVQVKVAGAEEQSQDVPLHGAHEHAHEHGHSHAHAEGVTPHHHTGIQEIRHCVTHLNIPEAVQRDVLAVYQEIAEAEGHVHGKPVDQIHFHEVGSMDAVADIISVCYLFHELAADCVMASAVHVGSGQVRCAHGILPVPAPATAYLLRGIPCYGGTIQGELCTPTGAALLRHFVSVFGPMPVMEMDKIGYGMGSKQFESANCVRAILGERQEAPQELVELSCNLDDMTPEAIGFATKEFFAQGALDVYTTAIQMKKNRPGVLLTCVCHMTQRDAMLRLMFQHTTTLGIREYICNRYALNRKVHTRDTKFGTVRQKEACGWGIQRSKLEYEDLARIAREQGLSIAEVTKQISE